MEGIGRCHVPKLLGHFEFRIIWVLDINMREPGNKKTRPKELASKELASKELGLLGYSDLLGVGVPLSGKGRCNVPPGGGTLQLHILSPMDRASMIGHR